MITNMITDETSSEIRKEFEALVEHMRTGNPLPREIEQRIADRAEKIRQKVFEKHGLVDIAVPSIRELRDLAES
jgi:hypothetical protein